MKLIEKHIIKQNNKLFKDCDEACFLAKNLYNAANYIIRQEFIKSGKYLNYYNINRIYIDTNQIDYIALPRKVSNWVLKTLDKNWVSFFNAYKKYKLSKNGFNGKPKLPQYLDKVNGRFVLQYEMGAVSRKYLKENIVKLSGTNICVSSLRKDIKMVRVVPRNKQYHIEIIYEVNDTKQLEDNGIYASIDLGLNNLATVTYNKRRNKSFIVNGRPLKSINQFYNKEVSNAKSLLNKVNNKKSSNKIVRLTNKRENKINDYLHKSSRYIVNQLVSNRVTKLVIGNNKNWKQDINIGKVNNQNFVQVPHSKFISLLEYKCKLCGIEVILHEESYTSKCSFFDNEAIAKHDKYCGKRIKRGLFRCGNGKLVNADVNGSYNIMRKAVPNAYADGIEGLSVIPLIINIL